MEALLLGIYATIVWLIYFKYKLLPWTTPHKVTVVIIPIVGLTTRILLLNFFAAGRYEGCGQTWPVTIWRM